MLWQNSTDNFLAQRACGVVFGGGRAMDAVDDRLIFLDKIFLWIFCKNVCYIEILVNFAVACLICN